MLPIDGHGVGSGCAAEDEKPDGAEQQPAERVSRLAPRHHEAQHTENRGQDQAATG
jgi:hypothetical protein